MGLLMGMAQHVSATMDAPPDTIACKDAVAGTAGSSRDARRTSSDIAVFIPWRPLPQSLCVVGVHTAHLIETR